MSSKRPHQSRNTLFIYHTLRNKYNHLYFMDSHYGCIDPKKKQPSGLPSNEGQNVNTAITGHAGARKTTLA